MRVKFPRAALVANIAIVATTLPVALFPVSTSTSSQALPLYQFVDSGSGPLPWNAVSFESSIDNTKMLGNPHAVSENGQSALAYRMANSQIGLYVQNANGTTNWTDLSTQVLTPSPESDPVPFFNPAGELNILYVATTNHLILITTSTTRDAQSAHLAGTGIVRPFVATDLTTLSGLSAANGLPSVSVYGQSGIIAVRSLSNAAEVLPLTWHYNQDVPIVGAALNVSSMTGVASIQSDPVTLAEGVGAFAATSSAGDVEVFTSSNASATSWSAQSITSSTGASLSAGELTSTSTGLNEYVGALALNGDVELFSAPLVSGVVTPSWSLDNVTATTSGSPPLDGDIFMSASSSQLFIAGQAANWGDLFVLTSPLASQAWTSTDVSVTAGSAARSVGTGVTGLFQGTSLVLYAAGVSSPPPEGVGVYAIPPKDWSSAITNGWPVISETGGLGTQSAPWVGFTSATSVAGSPDFLLGQSIYNSHKRVTWLSFWTVSGPLKGTTINAAAYQSHGFAAGVWVATQIDQYRSLGVGLKPDWVIFDPEGYPDNHSGLDAPSGSSNATLATYATYWSAMLAGWAAGLSSVDPSLKAAVYASQSEYRNYGLVNQPLPVFEAVAFGNGGPLQVAGATGANIRGYIAFGASCTPPSTLASEINTLKNPPWSGAFNTLQFNAGTYCAPAPT